MGRVDAQTELEAAGFPAATRQLVYAVPVDELAGGAGELELEVCVDGFSESAARMSVGYLPGGPVTAGQQIISRGETRVLRRQLVKPGAVFVVALDRPGHAEVRVRGARGWDVEEADVGDEQLEHWDVDGAEDRDADVVELDSACTGVGPFFDDERDELEADAKEISAIGAAAAATADRTAVMNGVIAQLERMYSTAQKERSTSFLLATGASVDEQLKNERGVIDYLKGVGFAAVVAGEKPLTSGNADAPAWLEAADHCGDTLSRIAGQVGSWNLGAVVGKVAPEVAKTAADVGKGTQDMLHTAAWILGLYVLARLLT